MIELQQVSFTYTESRGGVRDIDLTIRNGECVVLIGPSGGGKTTLTRLINGLAPGFFPGKFNGQIRIDQKLLSQLANWQIGQQIGSVFQDPKSQFFSSELPGEVAFACENYGLTQTEIVARTNDAIKSFGLDHLLDRQLDFLSSGEKQRVAIASVYALRPSVYVCDEPTANLDETGVEQLSRTLRMLKDERNTLIVAEHRLAWLYGLADRYIYLRDGQLGWQRTAEEMLQLTVAERQEYGLRESGPGVPVRLVKAATMAGDGLIVRQLACQRKRTRLFSDVSFSLGSGQIAAVTGNNGAGKSSLALVLSGLWKESSGCIEIGAEITSARKRRKRVWYSANDTGTQFFTNRVEEELLLNSDDVPERLERTRILLKRLGLYGYKDAHPATLSGGQKQRLSIACGLLSERDILIFDEPTSGLDGGNMMVIAALLKEVAQTGKCILVMTHDRELMAACCDCEIKI